MFVVTPYSRNDVWSTALLTLFPSNCDHQLPIEYCSHLLLMKSGWAVLVCILHFDWSTGHTCGKLLETPPRAPPQQQSLPQLIVVTGNVIPSVVAYDSIWDFKVNVFAVERRRAPIGISLYICYFYKCDTLFTFLYFKLILILVTSYSLNFLISVLYPCFSLSNSNYKLSICIY